MKNSKLLVSLGIVVVLLFALAMVGGSKTSAPVGGNFNPVTVDFAEGISVDGTTRISGTGAFTASSLTVTGTSSLGAVGSGVNYFKPVTTLTSDTTVTTAQSGTIFNIGTAGVDVTLPAPATSAGVHYSFVVSANFATTAMTIVAGTADTIEGSLIVAGAVVACDAADLISIAATSEDIGDFVDVFSNGTNWVIGANQAMTASQHTCSG